MLNIYNSLRFFNNNLYDYCRFHSISDMDELDYIFKNVLFIDAQYSEKDTK